MKQSRPTQMSYGWPKTLIKFLRMMRLATLLLFIGCLEVSATAYSQEPSLTLSLHGVSLEQAFTAIQRQSGYFFLYSNEKVMHAKEKVSIDLQNASIDQVMNACLQGLPLSYKVVDETIIVMPVSETQEKGETAVPQVLPGKEITGIVRDSATGDPLAGVTIKVQDEHIGTVTDAEGRFNLNVSGDNVVLEVSYLGYATKEIPVSGKSSFNILLASAATGLNQLVVVGYGTEKKINLTGAVDQISGEQVARNLGSKTGQVIQGLIPNLNVTYNNGGINESANINIRGVGSINGSGPLILIDGVRGDLNHISPSDIESISVLKDAASASIYGAQGAFGVVLITTKQAKSGKLSVNYDGYYSLSSPTIRTDNFITDGLKWARLSDKLSLLENSSTYLGYTEEDYAYMEKRKKDPSLPPVLIKTVDGKERYIHYGNTDWWNTLFSNRQPAMQHTLSLSGGTEKASFYLSGKYHQREGIYKINPDKLHNYTINGKINLKLTKWLEIENATNIYSEDYTYPATNTRDISGSSDHENWRKYTFHASPLYLPYNPDGTIMINPAYASGRDIADGTFADLLYGKSGGESKNFDVTNTISATIYVTDGLELHGDYSFRRNPSDSWVRIISTPNTNQPGGEGITLYKPNTQTYVETYRKRLYQNINAYATYTRDFGNDHSVSGMIGFNQEWRTWKRVIARRNGNLSEDLNSFNLATGENMELTSSANAWAIRAGFYRLKYNYKGKYLAEFNGRYDLSSKFPHNARAGFFPSVSAAWRASEEPFFDALSSIVNNFKLRASYGTLGNQNVGEYDYISRMSVNLGNYIMGDSKANYLTTPAPVSSNFTWERASTLDFGVDVSALNNRLSVTYDWFRRNTYDMLTQGKKLPSVFGASEPKENAADLSTKGFELSVQWRDRLNLPKPISYYFKITLADSRTEITRFDNPKGLIDEYYVGKELGEIWGYTVEGFFLDDNGYLLHADQTRVNDRIVKNYLVNHPVAGDIKFKDLNGDGVIGPGDKTLDNPGDLKVIGNTSPRYAFGISFGGQFNNFDLNVFLQGILKQNWWPGHDNGFFWGPFTRQYENFYPKSIVSDSWTPENPDAYFPRLAVYAANGHNNYEGAQLRVHSDKYLQDVGYMRLKNISLGYTLPNQIFKKQTPLKIRFYISGANILTFSKLYRHNKDHTVDPEQLGDGNAYPYLKTYAFGVNIKF